MGNRPKGNIATYFILSPAIKAGNLEVAQWIADSDKEFKKEWGLECGRSLDNFERALVICLRSDMFLAFHNCLSPVFNWGNWDRDVLPQAINTTSRCPQREETLIANWKSALDDTDLTSWAPQGGSRYDLLHKLWRQPYLTLEPRSI